MHSCTYHHTNGHPFINVMAQQHISTATTHNICFTPSIASPWRPTRLISQYESDETEKESHCPTSAWRHGNSVTTLCLRCTEVTWWCIRVLQRMQIFASQCCKCDTCNTSVHKCCERTEININIYTFIL